MARTAADYRGLIVRLLPEGFAWPTSGSTVFVRLLEALATTLAEVEGRAAALALEFDPRTATELLPEWLAALGLPGDCMGEIITVDDGRRIAGAKLGAYGGQTSAYFVWVAANLGFPVEIEEQRLFRAGDPCEAACYGSGWEFVWTIIAPHDAAAFFYADAGRAGDPLASFETLPLECLLNELKPAHTVLHFRYTGGKISPGAAGYFETRALTPILEES